MEGSRSDLLKVQSRNLVGGNRKYHKQALLRHLLYRPEFELVTTKTLVQAWSVTGAVLKQCIVYILYTMQNKTMLGGVLLFVHTALSLSLCLYHSSRHEIEEVERKETYINMKELYKKENKILCSPGLRKRTYENKTARIKDERRRC
jgi:hypothetical protein